MNVRITPRDHPRRTVLYGGVVKRVESDGVSLWIACRDVNHRVLLVSVADIQLDDEPGDWW